MLPAKRLRNALDGQDPEVEASEIITPSHLDLASAACPFTSLKTIVLNVRFALPTFGIETHDCAARYRAYVTGMTPTSTGSTLRGWRHNYVGAYILELNGHAISIMWTLWPPVSWCTKSTLPCPIQPYP
jgi:hypothetical protein